MKTVGFTGTSRGMNPYQKFEIRRQLVYLRDKEGYTDVRHGACIGADDQFGRIAKDLGYRITAHPGYSPRNPENLIFRAETEYCDVVLEPKPFIARDHDIVDQSDTMLATPVGKEERRSGTWTTIRYALKSKREILIVSRERPAGIA